MEEQLFGRWGRFVAGKKTKWLTLFIWIALAIILSLIAPSVNQVENNNAANLPTTAASVQAESLAKKAFPSSDGNPALVVWFNPSGLTTANLVRIQKAAHEIATHPLPGQQSSARLDQLPLPVLQQMRSKDQTTLILPVVFRTSTDSGLLNTDMSQLQSRITGAIGLNPFQTTSLASPGLHARITGPVGILTDALHLFAGADFALLTATVLLVLTLLILLYRSPLLALVPIVAVGFAYAVISPLLGLLAKNGFIIVDAQGVSIMTVLLFGAGTDYCLFLVARYRERLHVEQDKYSAMQQAVQGAAGAIAMSGLTVVVSLLALLFARYGSDHRFAAPFSLAVLIMALAGITLVPSLLAILGRAAFYPFIPRTPQMEQARAQRKGKPMRSGSDNKGKEPIGQISRVLGKLVATRPWPVAITATLTLIVLAGFSTQIQTTYNLLSSFPETMPSRQGFTLLANHFAPGNLAPLQVILDKGGENSALRVQTALEKLDFVQSVTTPQTSSTEPGTVAMSVTLKSDPYSTMAMDQLHQVREVSAQVLAGTMSNPKAHVWIAGQTATQVDTRSFTMADTKTVIPIVIAVIALLLLLYLRSVTATVYLIGTVLLSYFSALGAGWLILHNLLKANAIQGAIPLYAFVFLVALGEDYNIFMVSRIWQEAKKGRPLKEAISAGVSRTSSVITSAGLILAGTFAVLATLPLQVLVQFGVVTAIGVLLDTFIVRPFLVPSITAILGRSAFWPSRLDRVRDTE